MGYEGEENTPTPFSLFLKTLKITTAEKIIFIIYKIIELTDKFLGVLIEFFRRHFVLVTRMNVKYISLRIRFLLFYVCKIREPCSSGPKNFINSPIGGSAGQPVKEVKISNTPV